MIYLDYNATTPIDKGVAEAIQPYIREHFGNPSSGHALGKEAKYAVEDAREAVAELIRAKPSEILFTSGGSESNNTVIKGVVYTSKDRGNHIITSQIEHPAILNPCRFLEKTGYEITYLPVDSYGWVDPEEVRKAIRSNTILISIMHANNEVGTIEPIQEIGQVAREQGVFFHTDAAQSVGKIPVDVEAMNVDFLSIAGHKMYAPKGIGALYIRDGIKIEPLIHGAGQEHGRRAGTENVILIVALGAAARIAKERVSENNMQALSDLFYQLLKNTFGEKLRLNGHPQKRLPNTLNVSLMGHAGYEILGKLEGVAASTGSACHEGRQKLSPVLTAMKVGEEQALGAIRFSLGRGTTEEEILSVVAQVKQIIR